MSIGTLRTLTSGNAMTLVFVALGILAPSLLLTQVPWYNVDDVDVFESWADCWERISNSPVTR